MSFGRWHALEEALASAPDGPGVIQLRAAQVLPYPRGKSAMVAYAASRGGESLRVLLASAAGAALLARAHRAGARLIRFASASDPDRELARLHASFRERFGSLPIGHEEDDRESTMSDANSGSGAGPRTTGLTYRDAGVDIDAGDELVERIKSHVRRTMRPEVMTDLGGFAGLCGLPKGYRDPVLVACTDGVGTKLKLAFLTGRHDTVGIDLVAMNVNDLVVSGAEPLLFLDYFASGKLEVGVAEQVIKGIADGCREAGCALLGGETAELPGFYAAGEYDLAGFCVGVVEREGRADGRTIRAGDRLLGLASSGFHSNGYSLVRRVLLDEMKLPLDATPEGLDAPLADVLLRPTRIYVRALRRLYGAGLLKGAAHITGGGLVDNPPRMIPGDAQLKLQIRVGSWPVPPVFELLARGGGVAQAEMLRTFNMGIGMIVCVAPEAVPEATRLLESEGERVFEIGQVAASDRVDAPVELLS